MADSKALNIDDDGAAGDLPLEIEPRLLEPVKTAQYANPIG